MKLGPCAKAAVYCIVVNDGEVVGIGSNYCHNAQPWCPRSPGEDYTKCSTVCQQEGHAEAVAAASMTERGKYGGIAHLFGHYYACDDCKQRLAEVGVTEIKTYMTKEEFLNAKQANQSATQV